MTSLPNPPIFHVLSVLGVFLFSIIMECIYASLLFFCFSNTQYLGLPRDVYLCTLPIDVFLQGSIYICVPGSICISHAVVNHGPCSSSDFMGP